MSQRHLNPLDALAALKQTLRRWLRRTDSSPYEEDLGRPPAEAWYL